MSEPRVPQIPVPCSDIWGLIRHFHTSLRFSIAPGGLLRFFPHIFPIFYSLFLPFSPIRVLANGAGPRGLIPNATKAVPKFPSDSRLGNLLPNPPAFLLFSYLGNTHREQRLERESHGDKRALEFGLRE